MTELKRERNADSSETAPAQGGVALLIIDMINDLEFDDGDKLFELALPMAQRLATLKNQFRSAGRPIIYANDNFGRWKSDFRFQIEHCLEDNVRGKPLVELLMPSDEDYFVLKPKHSAFYATTLDVLLNHLQIKRLVITGVATDICVLFTGNDAYMRDFEVAIPADCVAANTQQRSDAALRLMQRVLKADISDSTQLIK